MYAAPDIYGRNIPTHAKDPANEDSQTRLYMQRTPQRFNSVHYLVSTKWRIMPEQLHLYADLTPALRRRHDDPIRKWQTFSKLSVGGYNVRMYVELTAR
jgi:hypothetical protein